MENGSIGKGKKSGRRRREVVQEEADSWGGESSG